VDDIHVKEIELVCGIAGYFFQFLCRDILVCFKLHLHDVVVPDNTVKDNESTRSLLFCSSDKSADIDILFLDRDQTFTRFSIPIFRSSNQLMLTHRLFTMIVRMGMFLFPWGKALFLPVIIDRLVDAFFCQH
jgi:hypothetical protein